MPGYIWTAAGGSVRLSSHLCGWLRESMRFPHPQPPEVKISRAAIQSLWQNGLPCPSKRGPHTCNRCEPGSKRGLRSTYSENVIFTKHSLHFYLSGTCVLKKWYLFSSPNYARMAENYDFFVLVLCLVHHHTAVVCGDISFSSIGRSAVQCDGLRCSMLLWIKMYYLPLGGVNCHGSKLGLHLVWMSPKTLSQWLHVYPKNNGIPHKSLV